MWPLLLLLLALEFTAALTGGGPVLTLYFYALGDPLAVYHTLLGRVRLSQPVGVEIVKELEEKRGGEINQALPASMSVLLLTTLDIFGDLDSAKDVIRQAIDLSQLSHKEQDRAVIASAKGHPPNSNAGCARSMDCNGSLPH
jgi:hypothetical protein